jgi:folate-binding protein YgfZ
MRLRNGIGNVQQRCKRAVDVFPRSSVPVLKDIRMPAAFLADRGIVRVAGADARPFLDGLVTSAVEKVTPAQSRWAALLTPQGKILFDFFVFEAPDGSLLLDVGRALAPDLAKRLGFYKLRAKVEVADVSEGFGVVASWDEAPFGDKAAAETPDPRWPALGRRAILPREAAAAAANADPQAYHDRRVRLGIPEGGRDFVYGDAFPHEADMDQLAGIDFEKGCYVGQEVVSRMQHRGSARTRVVPVAFADGVSPPEGTEATAGGKAAGRVYSSAPGGRALAMLRLDRVEDALAGGGSLEAGGLAFTVARPDFATFPIPGDRAKPVP